ncbi:uncharacterized protein LOC135398648 [Ornithodoros turicata]|uniref:uncharacterized protein LOC135398648 n=1 Tax=Ornithodoros turicata TaxID=34597 RepID=UPI00313890C2
MDQHQGDHNPATGSAQVNFTDIKLPSFWHNDPALWFVLAEAEFTKRHITSQHTKYYAALTALSASVMAEVRDIVTNPPSDNPYDTLKQQIIKRLSESQQQRLRQLLTTEELGDRKPTQFLRRMYQLLGDESSALDESILRELFLQRLPHTVQMILSASPTVPLRELSELADRIMEATPPFGASHTIAALQPSARAPCTAGAVQPAATTATCCNCDSLREEVRQLSSALSRLSIPSSAPDSAPSHRLEDEIAVLKTQLAAISARPRSPSPRRSFRPRSRFSPSRRFSPRRTPHFQLCWYHERFGKAATKCLEPCIFQENTSPGN